MTTRSRGRCSGNGLREGRWRVKAETFVVPAFRAARSAARSSSLAVASSSSSCNSIWSSSRAVRSERGPNSSRRIFSIWSFKCAINA